MRTVDIVFQKPFFPVFNVLSKHPGDEGSGSGATEEDPDDDKPVPDNPGTDGNG